MNLKMLALFVLAAGVAGAVGAEGLNGHDEIQDQFESLQHDFARRPVFQRHAPETFRAEALVLAADRDPADIVLRRTAALLADLRKRTTAGTFTAAEEQLADLQRQNAATAVTEAGARRALFGAACAARRRIAFANPLLNFNQLLFIKRHRALYNHMCDQFYGLAATPGGGLYVLEQPFGNHPAVRDVLANAVVGNGRLQGQPLSGGPTAPPPVAYDGEGHRSGTESGGGTFLSPSLSYDGRTILFAFVENRGDPQHRWHTDPTRGHWAEGRCYHLFQVGVDGRGLRQLTDGTWNDFDPCWLPNGRVAFISERRGGYLRCGRVCPLYDLCDMAADGSGINALSFHESNEWSPGVTHDGRIIYTRWDYVDRHGCAAHLPWITSLTGTDARALHGNFAPRPVRPDMELDVRAIPDSHKYVALAAPHHGQAYGSLIILDPRIPDDDAMGPVKRLTPEVDFPESQGGGEVYGSPYPLAEDYHLCVYDAGMQVPQARDGRGRYGIYLVDSFGNKELIYRDPEMACLSPIPLRPRPVPAVSKLSLPGRDAGSEAVSPGAPGEATMAVINVYDSIQPWPAQLKIKELRIYQLLPMSAPSGRPPHETGQRLAEAGDSVVPCRRVLGTVPVEADGSAHFVVPAYREVFFQALDEQGLAVQSMRSATYARNGERLVCQGCHEPGHRAPVNNKPTPLAFKRAPSRPRPDVSGSNPLSYPLLVQPVLERRCVECHEQNKDKAPNLKKDPQANQWYASYNSLVPYAYTSYGAGGDWNSPRFYRTMPGQFGARVTRLYALLKQGHHDVKLSAEDLHRLTLWLDSASMFYGVFEKEGGEAQLRGELAQATLE